MNCIYNIVNAIQNNEIVKQAALCIVIKSKGSTPRSIGAKMIVFEDRAVTGSIGGGALEKEVIENAINVLKIKKAQTYKHDLLHQHNMCCGGTVEIYIEPIMKKQRLYIFGAGHTGKALAKISIDLGFEVFIIDDRKAYLEEIQLPGINKMNLHYSKALHALPFDKNAFIVIMTYDHSYDRDILAFCLNKPHAYLGMIGSLRKVEIIRKRFVSGGISTIEAIDSVDMPIGLNIGAESPEEIAVSIASKLVMVRKNRQPYKNLANASS